MLAELQRLHTLIDTLTRQLQELRLDNETLRDQAPPEPDPQVKEALAKAIDQKHQQQKQLEDLTNRYESLALAHQTMSTEMERLASELAQQALARQQLIAERDLLRQKNEHAKQKVAEIIQRLASFGHPAAVPATASPATAMPASSDTATEQPS
jgi:DNA repair exonuclease SbcCD ATPase subunit